MQGFTVRATPALLAVSAVSVLSLAALASCGGNDGSPAAATVDAQVKAPGDKPTIGLLLCKQQNRLVAEYALSGIDKPIGVAEYQLLRDLPATLEQSLPSIADIEAELSNDMGARQALDALDEPSDQP